MVVHTESTDRINRQLKEAQAKLLSVKIGTVSFVILMFIGFNIMVQTASSSTNKVWEDRCYIEKLAQEATYWDEVLTMSTYVLVYSGNIEYFYRYDESIAPLDNVFAETERIVPDIAEVFSTKTGDANNQLIDLETIMIEAIVGDWYAPEINNQSNFAYAQSIIAGDEYWTLKEDYLQGVEDLKNDIASKSEQDTKNVLTTLLVVAVIYSVVCAAIGLFCLYMFETASTQADLLRDLASAHRLFNLEAIMSDSKCAALFQKHCELEYSGENVEFGVAVTALLARAEYLLQKAQNKEITDPASFTAVIKECEILWEKFGQDLNLSSRDRSTATQNLEKLVGAETVEDRSSSLEGFVKNLQRARQVVFQLLETNNYLSFLSTPAFAQYMKERAQASAADVIQSAIEEKKVEEAEPPVSL